MQAEAAKNLNFYSSSYGGYSDLVQQIISGSNTGGDISDYKLSGSPEDAMTTPEGRKAALSSDAWLRAYNDFNRFAQSEEGFSLDGFREGQHEWASVVNGIQHYDKAINTANNLWWPGDLITVKEKQEKREKAEADRARRRERDSDREAEEQEEKDTFRRESRPVNQGGVGRKQAMRNKNKRKNEKKQKSQNERRIREEKKRLTRFVEQYRKNAKIVEDYSSSIGNTSAEVSDPSSMLPNIKEFMDFVGGGSLSTLATDAWLENNMLLTTYKITDDGKIKFTSGGDEQTLSRLEFAKGPAKSIRSLSQKIQRAAPKRFRSKDGVDWQGAINAYKNIGSQVSNFVGLYNVPGTAFYYPDHPEGMGVHPMQMAAQQGLVNEKFYGITGTEQGFTYPAGMSDVAQFNQNRDPETDAGLGPGQLPSYSERGQEGISGGEIGEEQQRLRDEGKKVPRPLEMMLPGGAVQTQAFKDMDSITKFKEIEKKFGRYDRNKDEWLSTLEIGKMFWLASKSKGGMIEALSGGGSFGANSGVSAGSLSKGTDTRLAVLTPGEFVVNRSAASKNLGLLQAINNGNNVAAASKGGSIGYFSTGTPGNGEFMAKFQDAIGAFATAVSSISMSGQGAGNMDMNAMTSLTSALNNFPTSPGVQDLIKSLNDFTAAFASESIDVTLNTGGVDVKLTGTEQLAKVAEGNIIELISQKVQSAFFDLMSGQFAK